MIFGKKKGADKVASGGKTSEAARGSGTAVFDAPAKASGPVSLEFVEGGSGVDLLSAGWSTPEPSGSWSIGDKATVDLSSLGALGGLRVVRLSFGVYLRGPAHVSQEVGLTVAGVRLGAWTIEDTKPQDYAVELPGDLLASGPAVIEFDIAKAVSPASVGASLDERRLGILLRSISLQPAA